MNTRQGFRYVISAALLAFVAPTIAATPDSTLNKESFNALASLDGENLVSLTNAEMHDIQGGFFDLNLRNGFNIAIMPQINICVFCIDTNQNNFGIIFGSNEFP